LDHKESDGETNQDTRKTLVHLEEMSMALEHRKSEGSGSDEMPVIEDISVRETFFMEAFDYRANSREKSRG